MRKAAGGFTLVEFLVVISITAVIGIYTLSNYISFGENQNLKSAVLDIQSILRQAQTSATTNVQCITKYGATWQVVFSNATTLRLQCLEPTLSVKKTLELNTKYPNISMAVTAGSGSNCPTTWPIITTFTLLKGNMSFGDSRCISLSINLTDNKSGSRRSLIIEQGGRIYEQ